jgi:type I restriction enzyme S subunit
MDFSTFFKKFNQFADAPGAVPKMRGLILRHAMQGVLSVPQKSDVSVNELLRAVGEERAALGIKRSQESMDEDPEEDSFLEIPERWTWVRFGEIASHNAGKTLDKGRNRGELRDYITTSNLYWGFFELDEVRQMPIQDDELERCTATKGDLLIVEGGEAGRAAVWCHEHDIAFQNHIHRARFFAGINPHFVQRFFETLNVTGEIAKFRKGVGISNMSGKALASIPVPLPPLAEQKRIVAKVDELMALCDRLEEQQHERETRHATLARAALARFAVAPTPANLNLIFHSSFSVSPADIRKCILTFAIQGDLSAGSSTPSEWSTVKMKEVCDLITDGEHATPQRVQSGVPLTTAKNVRDGFLDMAQTDYVALETAEKCWKRCKPKHGDILMVCVGATTGRVCLVSQPPEMVLVRSVALLRPSANRIEGTFLNLFLRSPSGQKQVWGGVRQNAQPCLYLGKMSEFTIQLPPLAEQRRIVAKVEQLMALVDALEQQLAASRVTAEKLLTAIVAELTTKKLP